MNRTPPALVSVVIPARDPGTHLKDQLAALNAQSYGGPFEIIVADNGLAAETKRDVLNIKRASSIRLRIQDASRRVGAAHARNLGVAAAVGELIAFCDADDIVDQGWLAALVSASLNADVVAGRIGNNDSPPRYLRLVSFAGSGSMAIWRSVFRELDGFDESMLGAEDVELSWRATRSGYELTYAPDARIWRRPRRSTLGHFRQGERNGYWDSELLARHTESDIDAALLRRARSRLAWLVPRTPYLAIPSRRPLWIKHSGYLYGMARHFSDRYEERLKRFVRARPMRP